MLSFHRRLSLPLFLCLNSGLQSAQPKACPSGQGSLLCCSGHWGIRTQGQLQRGKPALSCTDSSGQAEQVIKGEAGEGAWGVGSGGGQLTWGMEDVEPPDDISTTSTPSAGALGAYTISEKEK